LNYTTHSELRSRRKPHYLNIILTVT
jgi:hypothetical protein